MGKHDSQRVLQACGGPLQDQSLHSHSCNVRRHNACRQRSDIQLLQAASLL